MYAIRSYYVHRATVTGAHLEYEGSLSIDPDLMEAAAILPYEAIICSNLNNGERFMTYAIGGRRGSGDIVLNGPTARKAAVGDQIIIFCYVITSYSIHYTKLYEEV